MSIDPAETILFNEAGTFGPWDSIVGNQGRGALVHVETAIDAEIAGITICSINKRAQDGRGEANAFLIAHNRQAAPEHAAEVLRLREEVKHLSAELAWHEEMNGTRAEQEADDAEADALDAAADALTPEQIRAELIEVGLDPDQVAREAEVSARLVVRCVQVRAERDEARLEADAFATYREMTTTALGIDPASCADDVAEAIDALKKERGEARHERDIAARDWGLVDDALDAAGVATANEDGAGLSPWARVAALTAERDELRLAIAAEQGRATGVPYANPEQMRAAVNAERIRRGMSWRSLAEAAGIAPSGLTRWNQGRDLNVAAYLKLCDWLRAMIAADEKESTS